MSLKLKFIGSITLIFISCLLLYSHHSNTDTYTVKSKERLVTVLLVVDEEYREKHDDWKSKAESTFTRAAKKFHDQYSIIFELKAMGKWNSQGSSSEEILKDLDLNWNKYDYDFVIGITADHNFKEAGIAEVYSSPPSNSAISIVYDQNSNTTWKSLVHEISHNFGLKHHENSTVECFMNNKTMYNSNSWEKDHQKQIIENSKWYGAYTE